RGGAGWKTDGGSTAGKGGGRKGRLMREISGALVVIAGASRPVLRRTNLRPQEAGRWRRRRLSRPPLAGTFSRPAVVADRRVGRTRGATCSGSRAGTNLNRPSRGRREPWQILTWTARY